MWEALVQKFLSFFQQKILAYSRYYVWIFNVPLTNDVVSFEQPGPDQQYTYGNTRLHATHAYSLCWYWGDFPTLQ